MSPDRRIERLVIGMVGPRPPPAAREVAQRLSRLLPIPCSLRNDPLPVAVTILDGRAQIDADRLLGAVEELAVDPGVAVCGLTVDDIGHPLFTHFFGRARRGGRAMIVSLARLSPAFYGLPDDAGITIRRAVLEILHELGHAAGLLHCDDFRCLMRFAPTVEAIDTRGDRFCADCLEAFRAQVGGTPRRGRRVTEG